MTVFAGIADAVTAARTGRIAEAVCIIAVDIAVTVLIKTIVTYLRRRWAAIRRTTAIILARIADTVSALTGGVASTINVITVNITITVIIDTV